LSFKTFYDEDEDALTMVLRRTTTTRSSLPHVLRARFVFFVLFASSRVVVKVNQNRDLRKRKKVKKNSGFFFKKKREESTRNEHTNNNNNIFY